MNYYVIDASGRFLTEHGFTTYVHYYAKKFSNGFDADNAASMTKNQSYGVHVIIL